MLKPSLTYLIVIMLTGMLSVCPEVRAQATAQPEKYRWDLGAGAGMTGYIGDANESGLFSNASFGASVSMRYLLNTRFAMRGLLNIASLSGSTADMENVLPLARPIDFKTTLYDLQVRGEFNFFSYGIGESYKRLSRVSPYLALGLGLSLGSGGGNTNVAMSIPMAFGIKYKIKPRLNLGLEFSMTKILGDRADSQALDDPYLIKSSFIKNTDWYSTIMLGISWEFGERCVECHRLD